VKLVTELMVTAWDLVKALRKAVMLVTSLMVKAWAPGRVLQKALV